MIKINFIRLLVSLALLAAVSSQAYAEQKVTVYAAASLTNAISDIAAQYEKAKGVKVVSSFAASSALAKQIENGAPADVFISADSKWMNYLQDKNKIDKASRHDLLGQPPGIDRTQRASRSKWQMDKVFRFCQGI